MGTGSSAIQMIPVIAEDASSLTVFQRSQNYSVPAQNHPMDPQWLEEYKSRQQEIREKERKSPLATYWSAFENGELSALEVSAEEREREYEWRWQRGGAGFMVSYADLVTNMDANRTASDFVRRKIKETVTDPEKARKLLPPPEEPIACKRLCCDSGYYETFNRETVTIVDLNEDPIEAIESEGIRTRSNQFELDVLVLATGFDAYTGALDRIDIRGRGGLALRDKWKDGPRNYLGVVASGFPNLMAINGPLTAIGNFMMSTELLVDWITDLIVFAETKKFREFDAIKESEDEWVKRSKQISDGLIAMHQCNSYFVGANVPGKARGFLTYMGGIGEYHEVCGEIARSGYPGFDFRP